MVLLEDPNSFDLIGTVSELRTKWKLKVNDNDSEEKAAVLINLRLQGCYINYSCCYSEKLKELLNTIISGKTEFEV